MFSFINKVGREEMFSFPNVSKSSFINKVGREEVFSFINKVGRRKCLASPTSASRASSIR